MVCFPAEKQTRTARYKMYIKGSEFLSFYYVHFHTWLIKNPGLSVVLENQIKCAKKLIFFPTCHGRSWRLAYMYITVLYIHLPKAAGVLLRIENRISSPHKGDRICNDYLFEFCAVEWRDGPVESFRKKLEGSILVPTNISSMTQFLTLVREVGGAVFARPICPSFHVM